MTRQWYREEKSQKKALGWEWGGGGWGGDELSENTEWPGRMGGHSGGWSVGGKQTQRGLERQSMKLGKGGRGEEGGKHGWLVGGGWSLSMSLSWGGGDGGWGWVREEDGRERRRSLS